MKLIRLSSCVIVEDSIVSIQNTQPTEENSYAIVTVTTIGGSHVFVKEEDISVLSKWVEEKLKPHKDVK